jgi:hypothetical protein
MSDAKAFVAKGRTIGKGYIFFESRSDTLHGRAFQRTLRRLSTRGLYHACKSTDYTDGSTKYVNRLYSKAPNHLSPDWRNA